MLKHALVAFLLILGASASRAQDLSQPLLLVASADLKGPYSRTAVLVVPIGGQHFGFILNRATEVKLATLFPEHAPSAKVADPVFFGGPERINAIFAVVPRNPGGPSVHLFGDLYVTVQAEAVDRIIEQTPNDARFFAGFVGWRPGELAAEIESGYWYAAEPDAALVFKEDTGAMWETLIQRLGKPAGKGMQQA